MAVIENSEMGTRQAARTRPWSRASRLRMYRRLVAQRDQSSKVVVKVAETPEERSAAFRLLHDEYVRAGLSDSQPSGMRVTPYHALPTTRVFIAVEQDVIVGTLSLIQRASLGVPAEEIFDISPLCGKGVVAEEVSSLAMARSVRSRGQILFSLFRSALKHSMRRGVGCWVATFNPSHRFLYEEILGFESVAHRSVRSYDFVKGAPAMGARLDVRAVQQNLSALYGTNTERTPYTWFFVDEENAIEPEPELEPASALVVA